MKTKLNIGDIVAHVSFPARAGLLMNLSDLGAGYTQAVVQWFGTALTYPIGGDKEHIHPMLLQEYKEAR